MTGKDAIEYIRKHMDGKTEPSDLISRAEAVEEIDKLCARLESEIEDAKEKPQNYTEHFITSTSWVLVGLADAQLELTYLSSVSAERVGVWVKPKEHDHMRECSICEYEIPNDIAWESNYCPNCGAKMKGEDNER